MLRSGVRVLTEWPVVINESRAPEYEEFGGGLTAFLVALLRGDFESDIFPKNFPGPAAAFRSV